MIKSLNKVFVPELRKLNFKGSMLHFRRTEGEITNLITFQFDRDGGGFVIELVNWRGSEFKDSAGNTIPLNKLTAHHINKRQRIYPNSILEKNGKQSWFRFDKNSIFDFRNKFDRVAKKVRSRLPIMEEYWNNECKCQSQ